jgi:hypothetical protein
METVNRSGVKLSLLVASAALLGASIVAGQSPAHGQQKHGQSTPAAGEIFCLAKSAGQLCTHGSADLLNLEGAKKERWTELASRYNKAVDAATKQLLTDAKAALSPDEYAVVEKWFEKSLNGQLNRQLLGTGR